MASYPLAASFTPRLSSLFLPLPGVQVLSPVRLGWRSWICIHGQMAAQTNVGSGLWVDLSLWDTQGEAFTSVLKTPLIPTDPHTYLSFWWHIRIPAL